MQEEIIKPTLKKSATVPISFGFWWFIDGIRLLLRYPLQWSVSMSTLIIVTVLAGIIPGVSMAMMGMGPVFIGGLMLSALSASEADGPGYFGWSKGFRYNRENLISLSLMQIIVLLLILPIIVMLIYPKLSIFWQIPPLTPQREPTATFGFIEMFLVATLTFFALFIALLFWAAPALTAIHGVSAWYAMKESAIGGLKNIPALTLYIILMILLLMLTTALIFAVFILTSLIVHGTGIFSHGIFNAIKNSVFPGLSDISIYIPSYIFAFIALTHYSVIGICGAYLAYRDIYTS